MEQAQQASKNKGTQNDVLPLNTTQAVQHLIKVSQMLLDLAERETQALVQNDLVSFSILQDEKELLTDQYTKASGEFRARLNEFRSVDPMLLARLETLQTQLKDKTGGNTVIVERMRARAQQNTQKTLVTAQELGQVKFTDTTQQEGA